jgi:hypothetical protein
MFHVEHWQFHACPPIHPRGSDLRNTPEDVISTEAPHSFTVRGAAEKPASLPKPTVWVEKRIPPLRYATVGMTLSGVGEPQDREQMFHVEHRDHQE